MIHRKITFFIYHFGSGGAERVISILANEFSRTGNDVEIITVLNCKPYYELDERVKFNPLSIRGRGIVAFSLTFITLVLHLYKSRPSIVISFIDRNNVIAVMAAKILGIPVIISERSNPEKYKLNGFLRRLIRMLYKRANAIVLQTSSVISSFKRLDISLPLIEVIANPINEIFFKKNLSIKKNIILTVGRLSNEKGHDILLKTLPQLDLTKWKVKIVGDGLKADELKSQCKDLNLEHVVTFCGRQSEVVHFYDEAKIFVLPSRFEGFPNALIEAMSRGCAVISTNCHYGPSEILDESNGLLIPVDDVEALATALESLIKNDSFIEELSGNARISALNYEVNQIYNKWKDLIEKLIRK